MTGKVLLVTQDTEAGQLWADALQRHGLEIAVGPDNGLSQHWEEDGFDLAVVDAHNQCDGLKVCQRLRAGTVNPILLLAASCDDDFCVAAYRAGVDECIEKPVSPAILVAKVQAWLRHARMVPG